jgi:hypothetical protein
VHYDDGRELQYNTAQYLGEDVTDAKTHVVHHTLLLSTQFSSKYNHTRLSTPIANVQNIGGKKQNGFILKDYR